MTTAPAGFRVRPYATSDEQSWLRCRALSFLDSHYYDGVRPRRNELDAPSLALVAVATVGVGAGDVIGILDLEVSDDLATIDTVATHPDHQGRGIATSLLDAALLDRGLAGVTAIDAWTREDAAANRWYQQNGFRESFHYLHVYLDHDEDGSDFETPANLSVPVTAFMHARLSAEAEMRARFRRVYVCRQYLRGLDPA